MAQTPRKRRKTRQDCVYVIYRAVCDATGLCYVGLTRRGNTTPRKAVHLRWAKHQSRARCENRAWALYEHMREGYTEFSHEVLETVRGRAAAYAREREIVLEQAPQLNTQYN